MNIDLLLTRRQEVGLVCDTSIGFKPSHAILDYEAGHLTLHGNEHKNLWLNIPIAVETIEKMIQTMGLHIGYIKSGLIEEIIYVPLVISTAFDINVERFIPPSRLSAVTFEIFMKECILGQAIHRDEIKNDDHSSGILKDLSPSVLKFAPTLAHQKKMELAYSAAPQMAMTLGMGLGGGNSTTAPILKHNGQKPVDAQEGKTIILNPINADDDQSPNPMAFFTPSALSQKRKQEREEKLEAAKTIFDSDISDTLESVHSLIGMAPLKERIVSIAHMAKAKALRTINDLPNTSLSLHMVFTGAPGTGKTTAARLIAKIMKDLGYLKLGHLTETTPNDMRREGTEKIVEDALGGVLFIDEAYAFFERDWEETSSEIPVLLKLMEDHRDELIVIVAGYAGEMRKFINSNPGLASRFSLVIDFPNYTAPEMVQIFEKLCEDNSYTADKEALDKLYKHLSPLGNNDHIKSFGNGRGVRNLFEKTLMAQSERIISNAIHDPAEIRRISAEDVLKNLDKKADVSPQELEELLEPLNKMVGLDNVKKDIRDLVHVLQANILRQKADLPVSPIVLHSLFMGPPGTGKTTIARILGKILKRLGYLEKGHVVEVDKSKLTGKWLGWSGKIAEEAFHEAEGGILFIDEAYALADNGPNWNGYGQESLTTILKLMEDHRDKVMVICAGYEKEMKNFLKSNSGLESRFPRHVLFKPYTVTDLVSLFENLCAENKYIPTATALSKLQNYLRGLTEDELNRLGNARLVRNIFEKTVIAQSRRITSTATSVEGIVAIEESDIEFPDNTNAKKMGFV